MELINFINLLKKHRYALIAIPVLVMVLVFALVRKQPNTYVSKSRLAAGIVDGSPQIGDKETMQDSKINQAFSNLIQTLQFKTVVDQVSYQLILHDLTTDKPFRKPSKLLSYLNNDARKHAIEVYTHMYNNHQRLSLLNPDEAGLNEVLLSMGYDNGSISSKMKIYRIENSDFIDMEYESDNPYLSAFVINTLCKEFISYYTKLTKQNELKAINFLDDLLQQKKDSLNTRMQKLKQYKINNRVLNLNEQAKSLYGQMADFETRLEVVQKDIEATTGAISKIDNMFTDHERAYMEGKLASINKEIVLIKDQLTTVNDEYIKSNFDPELKTKVDSLKNLLTKRINQSSDKYIISPVTTKENLATQKLTLQINLELSKSSVKSLQEELVKLNKKFDLLVPNEAVIQSYESDISVASQEYIEILKKFNQTSMESSSSIRLKQIEVAMPGKLQPSKKMILVIMAGVVSFVFYLLILFVLFYLDNSIKVSSELANATGIPVLGFLPLIRSSVLDITKMWDKNAAKPVAGEFKDLLRSLRFEIDMSLKGSRTFVITSIRPGEGKSLVAISLASAYLMVNKKVLLIDGNFNSAVITEITQPDYYIEDYLKEKSTHGIVKADTVNVLGNRSEDISLFEINKEETIRQLLLELKDSFDVIIIDAPSLEALNKAKEWVAAADKVVAVFEANKSLSIKDKQQIAYLKTLNDKLLGWVLNKVVLDTIKTKEKKSLLKKKIKTNDV